MRLFSFIMGAVWGGGWTFIFTKKYLTKKG
jgi:hypothetical protein